MNRPANLNRPPTPTLRLQRRGPWYDPNCPRCEFGWIDSPPGEDRDSTMRCYDCQAREEAMTVPSQRGGLP